MLVLAIFAGQLAAAGGVDIVDVFAQYGILGLGFLGLALFARGAYKRESDRADRLEEKNDKLNGLILEKIIPLLESATRSNEDSTELLRAIQRERELAALTDRNQPRPGG